jgi:hypothetical protein
VLVQEYSVDRGKKEGKETNIICAAFMLGEVVYTYNPSHSGDRVRQS